jgi:hypothetical protein
MSNSYYEKGANHYDHHKELHIDKVNGGDIGKLISAFFKDDAEEAEIVDEVMADVKTEELGLSEDRDDNTDMLKNYVFKDEIFTQNNRLISLRNAIAETISAEDGIDLTSNHEWFWLYESIYDAGLFETRKGRANTVTDVGFIKQIAVWFPEIISTDDEEQIRKLCKSMSAERKKWKMNGKPISLTDMEANKRRLTGMKEDKINRIIKVAYQGLYLPLVKLKEKWQALGG